MLSASGRQVLTLSAYIISSLRGLDAEGALESYSLMSSHSRSQDGPYFLMRASGMCFRDCTGHLTVYKAYLFPEE